MRLKLLFYDGDTLEESPPLPLRPIRDGHFTTGQGFVTFLNPGADGRMQHLSLAGGCTNEVGERGGPLKNAERRFLTAGS